MALRQLAVFMIVSLLLRSGESQCLNGFASIDTLIDKAASVGNLVRRERQQRIFPAISFSCSATVSGWIFVAEDRAGKGRSLYPELQIWRTANTRQYSVLHSTSQQPSRTESLNVYRYSGISAQVQSGDILGVYQPEGKKSRYTLAYQEGGGPTNYRKDARDPPTTFSSNGAGVRTDQNDYPLVGVEISNPACLHGFLGIAALRAKGRILAGNPSGVVERDRQQRIFPGINFSCNGTLKKWTFAAEDKGVGVRRNVNSHFQIWRQSSSVTYNRVSSSTLQPQRTSDLNVYEYLPDPPLNFQAGDILGIYQPAADRSLFGTYYQLGTGPTNYRIENQVSEAVSFNVNNGAVRSNQNDLPLVAVEISVDCGPPPSPEHGSVLFSSTTMGSRVLYSCYTGYLRMGPLHRECLATNGQWSDRTPTCVSVDCGVPPSIQHGSISYASTNLWSTAMYRCDEGFLPTGIRRRQCFINGRWTGSNLTCHGVHCDSLHDPPNGHVAASRITPGTDLGSTAGYNCDDGYRLVGPRTRTCQANGQWTEESAVCERIVDCGNVEDPENGWVNLSGVGEAATAEYYCSVGYTLVDGSQTRRCGGDSQWIGAVPTCQRIVDCGNVEDPENGWVNVSGVGEAATAEYYCSDGYRLVDGSQTRRCGEDSQWIGAAPTCQTVDCGSLSINHGAVVTEATSLGSVAQYSCESGYALVGGDSRTCEANGVWSGEEPLCVMTTRSSPPHIAGHTPSSLIGEATPQLPQGTPIPTSSVCAHCQLPQETPSSVGARCHWDDSGSGGEQLCNSVSLPEVSKVTPPQQGSPGLFQIVIGAIVALLSIAIMFVCGTTLLLYIRRKKYRSTAANVSVENPTYSGDSSTLNPQSCVAKEIADLQEDEQGQIAETRMDGSHYYDSADLYDQPVRIATNRGSPHYEMAPAMDTKHHYEVANVGDSPHYEMASLNSPYEVPVSPYEIPTSRGKSSNIYGTMLWGIYVPTEEQRRLSAASSVGVYMTPSCRSSQRLTFFEESEIYWKPASDSASLYEQLAKNKYREILRHQIQITEHLGSGQFGMVDKGLWQSPGETVEVAVKTLKPGSTENDRVKFLQEAAINGQFQHPNVVKLHGVVTVGEPVMIVLELLVNGDLRDYLMKNRPVPGEMVPSNWPGLLLGFCKDIVSGMEYLSRKAFVHRDLAARNILVAEDRVCKISDFGLSRDLEEESYYISNGGKVPVKWTAPEALHFKKYSTASDVWSYGAVMYEIWSLGHKPFEGYTNLQTIKAIDQGIRLQPPPGCPEMVYKIMIQCWHPETSSRPTFTRLLQTLSSPVTELLGWSEEDMRVHSQAAVLGATLEASKHLYPELQGAYLHVQQQ